MTWTPPTTVSEGDAIKASAWNNEIANNMAELEPLFKNPETWELKLYEGTTARATTNTTAAYITIGNLIFYWFWATMAETGTGTASTWNVNMPTEIVNFSSPAPSPLELGMGTALIRDVLDPVAGHAVSYYATVAAAISVGPDRAKFMTTSGNAFGTSPSAFVLASGDWIRGSGFYLGPQP